MQINELAIAVTKISTATGTPKVVGEMFTGLVRYIEATGWFAACHSSSAVLHMLLKERGIDSVIKIGEVAGYRYIFDHSWVEIDGKIFDAAVAYPDRVKGKRLSGVVYAGIDVDTDLPCSLTYGAGRPGGLDTETQEFAAAPLGVYFQLADRDALLKSLYDGSPRPVELWHRAAMIADQCGIRTSPTALASKYFDVRREQVYI